MLFRWRDTLCFAFFCKNLSTWHSFFIIFGVCMFVSVASAASRSRHEP